MTATVDTPDTARTTGRRNEWLLVLFTGSTSIAAMRTNPKFVRVTGAGMRESHVHDVQITKEAPNYRVS